MIISRQIFTMNLTLDDSRGKTASPVLPRLLPPFTCRLLPVEHWSLSASSEGPLKTTATKARFKSYFISRLHLRKVGSPLWLKTRTATAVTFEKWVVVLIGNSVNIIKLQLHTGFTICYVVRLLKLIFKYFYNDGINVIKSSLYGNTRLFCNIQ